jgi:RNA polymerase sigma-70 factor (sigma-E family)
MQGTEVAAATGDGGWPAEMVAQFRESRVEMVRLAHLVTGSNAVAEEVVQEAFLRVRAAWPRVDNPRAYLRTTVVNLARGHVRRRGMERRHAATLPVGPDTTTGDPAVDETWAAVCRLPSRQRAVLALRFYEDLSVPQIAEVLGCRLGTVKSSLHRGLARLRKDLS